MKAFACRLLGAGRCDIAVVLANNVAQLFYHLDEMSSPYQYEIVKLSDRDTGIINLQFIKMRDDEDDEYFGLEEEHPIDHSEMIGDLPDLFEQRTRYRIEDNINVVTEENDYVLIKLKKKEMPFG